MRTLFQISVSSCKQWYCSIEAALQFYMIVSNPPNLLNQSSNATSNISLNNSKKIKPSAFRKLSSVYVFSYFPFGFEGRIWDLIVSVPDHFNHGWLNVLDIHVASLNDLRALVLAQSHFELAYPSFVNHKNKTE